MPYTPYMNSAPNESKTAAYVPSSSLFAKLLADENLTVAINASNRTAMFNPKTRVLTLPNWQGFESDAWYMLIAHEVGHALFTPVVAPNDARYMRIARENNVTLEQVDAVVNILDDIRIERKVRAKYRGLSGFFLKGYRDLLSRDFFGIGPSDKLVSSGLWDKMKTLDKLNLYGKVGGLLDLKLTEANQIKWYNASLRTETHPDVVTLAEEIIKTIRDIQEQKKEEEQKQEDQKKKDESSKPDGKPSDSKDKSKDQKNDSGKSDSKSDKNDKSKSDKSKNDSKDSESKPSKSDKKDKDDSKRTDKPKQDIEERDADDPREKPEESEGTEPEPEKGEEDGDEQGESEGSESDEQGEEDGDSEGEGSEGDGEGDEGESDSEGGEGEGEGDSDSDADSGSDAGESDGDSEGEGSESGGNGGNRPAQAKPTSASQSGDSGGVAQSQTASAANFDDGDMASATAAAAQDRLANAADPYGRSTKRHILPNDFKFLNSQDVPLSEVLRLWTATVPAKTILRNAVSQFKRQSGMILSSMVSTFRSHQSAIVARKVQISKTGSIDTSKLASYKVTEDIFLRRSSVAKGQNHGFVVNIDWSGSMSGSMPTVLWQTLNLIWFAETLRVPIEIYSFYDGSVYGARNQNGDAAVNAARAANGRRGYGTISRQIQLYTSSATLNQKNDAQAHILALMLHYGGAGSQNSYYNNGSLPSFQPGSLSYLPEVVTKNINQIISTFGTLAAYNSCFQTPFVSLNGTPLHNALFASIPQIRAFREKNRVEKCISVWLTDGDNTGPIWVGDPKETDDMENLAHNSGIYVSPMTGKEYDTNKISANTFAFQHHKDATGATVIVLDLASGFNGLESSLRRYIKTASINTVTGKNKASKFATKGGKTKSQIWNDTGILVVDRSDAPEMGTDAVIVTDINAWMDSASNAYTTAAAKKVSGAVTASSGLTSQQTSKLSNVIRTNMGNVVMRRFADMLVPFMAKGEV